MSKLKRFRIELCDRYEKFHGIFEINRNNDRYVIVQGTYRVLP